MNGAATNPDAHVVAYAAAQVKKGLEIAKKLGAENFGKYVRSLLLCHCLRNRACCCNAASISITWWDCVGQLWERVPYGSHLGRLAEDDGCFYEL